MGFLEHVGSANLIVTPFILIVLALVPRLNKKYAPAGRYTLWIMVMVGLVFPFTTLLRTYQPAVPIAITVNLPAVNEQPRQHTHLNAFAVGEVVYAEPPRAESVRETLSLYASDSILNAYAMLPVMGFELENAGVSPAVPSGIYQPNVTESYSQAEAQHSTQPHARIFNFNFPSISIAAILIGVWAAGAVIFAIYQMFGHVIFVRRIRRWQLPVSAEMRALFEEEKQRMGITKRINLAYARGISAPMLTGLVRPAVFLADTSYTPQELILVFRHELTHYRHKDLWYKLALIAVRSLYWYNPTVHLMARQACKDLETLCDYAVTSDMDMDGRKFYSGLILSMAAKTVRSPLTSHISGSGMVLKQRLTSILQGNKPSNKKIFVVLGLALLMAGFFIGFRFAQPYYAYAYTIDAAEQAQEQEVPRPVAHSIDNVFLLSVYCMVSDILITQGGDTLTIRYDQWLSEHSQLDAYNGRVRLSFNAPQDGYYAKPVEIIIPEGMKPGITITLGEGNLYISDVYIGGIVVNSSAGDAIIHNSAISNGTFNINAGSLEMENTQFEDMQISAPFGNVNICLAEHVFSHSIAISTFDGSAMLGSEIISNCEFQMVCGLPTLRINSYFGSVAVTCPYGTVGSGTSEAYVREPIIFGQYGAGHNMWDHVLISMPFVGVLARDICARDRDFFELPSAGVMIAGQTISTGLQMRDIIVAIEGNPVVTKKDIANLRTEVRHGGNIEVTLYRNGERYDVLANLSWR